MKVRNALCLIRCLTSKAFARVNMSESSSSEDSYCDSASSGSTSDFRCFFDECQEGEGTDSSVEGDESDASDMESSVSSSPSSISTHPKSNSSQISSSSANESSDSMLVEHKDGSPTDNVLLKRKRIRSYSDESIATISSAGSQTGERITRKKVKVSAEEQSGSSSTDSEDCITYRSKIDRRNSAIISSSDDN